MINLFGKNKPKFVIFGRGRSGTTLLRLLLDSHEAINCEGELLNIKDGYITNPFLLKIAYRLPILYFNYQLCQSKYPVYGFTLLYSQCIAPEWILRSMQRSGWKIIHIYRNNTIEQAFSNLVAMKTKYWHRWNNDQTEFKGIYIDDQVFIDKVRSLVKNKARELEMMEKYKRISINYEHDLLIQSNWQSTAEKIFEYVGVQSLPVTSTLKKTHSKPYSELVLNYSDLILKLKTSDMAHLLLYHENDQLI